MIQDNYNILSEMLTELKQELSDLNAQIHRNLLYIREAEFQLNSFEGEDSDDFKIFSPRSMTDQHREKIEKLLSFKADFEERNRALDDEKKDLERKIDQLERILKQEYDNIAALQVQEEDRQRIAGDLHDTSLQNLTHLIHKIELCQMYIDQDPVKAKLELSLVSNNLKEIVEEIRNTIFDLRPMTFDDLGLKAAFERLLEKVNEKKEYEIISDIDDVSCENNSTLLYLYRVVQEGLNNIIKHADAKKICFSCKVKDSVCVIDMCDDGQGFYDEDMEKMDKHFGLTMMKERIELLNGRIDISSVRGEGTKIHIEIPVE